jgi:hypothetical protein
MPGESRGGVVELEERDNGIHSSLDAYQAVNLSNGAILWFTIQRNGFEDVDDGRRRLR